MKDNLPSLFSLFILAAVLASCTGQSRSVLVTADAATADALATEFLFKPTRAWTKCSLAQGAINLFEHEGRRPKDSSLESYGGRRLGALNGCTAVDVLARRWSVYDSLYYYLVEAEGQRGWVAEFSLSFEAPRLPTSAPSSSD